VSTNSSRQGNELSPGAPGQGTRPTAKTRFCRPGALTGRPTLFPRVRSSEPQPTAMETESVLLRRNSPKHGESKCPPAVPTGTSENSPAIYRCGRPRQRGQSRRDERWHCQMREATPPASVIPAGLGRNTPPHPAMNRLAILGRPPGGNPDAITNVVNRLLKRLKGLKGTSKNSQLS